MANAVGNPNIKNIGFKKKENCTPEQWAKQEEYRSRQKGVPHKRIWTKEKCTEVLDNLLNHLNRILKEDKKLEVDNPKKLKQENVRDAITLINKILDVMRYLYPPVQQSVNMNIDITADAILERLKNWKKKQIVVIGEEDAQE